MTQNTTRTLSSGAANRNTSRTISSGRRGSSASSTNVAIVDLLAKYENGTVTFCRPRDENDSGPSFFVEPGNGAAWMQANPLDVLLTEREGGFDTVQVRLTVFSQSPLPTVTVKSGGQPWDAGSPRDENRELPFTSPVMQSQGDRVAFSLELHVGPDVYTLGTTLDTSGAPPTDDDDIIIVDPPRPDPNPIP